MRCKCLTCYTETRAQIKTLLPSSVMVKISLTDFVQIALLLVTLYMTLHYKHRAEVNILGDEGVRFCMFFVLFFNFSAKEKNLPYNPDQNQTQFWQPTIKLLLAIQTSHQDNTTAATPPPPNKNSLLNKVRL